MSQIHNVDATSNILHNTLNAGKLKTTIQQCNQVHAELLSRSCDRKLYPNEMLL